MPSDLQSQEFQVAEAANVEAAENSEAASQVQLLGSKSYRVRQRAAEWLMQNAEVAENAIRDGQASKQIEVRRACERLLRNIHHASFERSLEQLLSNYNAAKEYPLPAWELFRDSCGCDVRARALYCRLARRETSFMNWLQRVYSDPAYDVEQEIDDVNRYLSPSEARLSSGDPVYWTLMLLAGTQRNINRIPVLGSRIRAGLLDAAVVNRLSHNSDNVAIRRLLAHWLTKQVHQYATRTQLKIALLYKFKGLGERFALQTLDAENASPSATQMALFLLATQSPQIARSRLPSHLSDQRVCQVWQIVATHRTAVQTQVRDTALALLLHLNDIDVRQVGFRNLQADPVTIFREHSLGFETADQREAAHREGARLLSVFHSSDR